MTPDCELLRRYVETGSEESFAELVRRHLDLVYSAALRQVNGDTHLAQDVAQTVFADLARKAAPLSRRAVLTGWLYTSALFAAAKAVRAEQRRRAREQEAQTMRELLDEPAPDLDWNRLRPLLDEAMLRLKQADREAILLRYFENREVAEIGARLGLHKNAARMRIDRALEKLHAFLVRRGVATTTAALSTTISANAVQVAPAGLAATLAGGSLAGGAAGAGTTVAILKFMAMTKIKIGAVAALAAAVAAPLVIQHQNEVRLRAENSSLHQQLEQLAGLTTQNERLSNQLAQVTLAGESLADEFNNLSRLRGEVTALRAGANELAKLQEENRRLKTAFSQTERTPTVMEAARIEPGQTDFPKESWAFAGYATPEATLQTALAALRNRDLKFYLKTLTPDARQRIDTVVAQDESANEFTAEAFNTLKGWSGFRIVNREVLDANQILLHLQIPGVGEQIARMQKVDDDWRFAGFDQAILH